MPNGAMHEFFDAMEKQGLMLTYDDVRLRSRHSDIQPTSADVSTRLTRNITLKIPIVSSPMDTVTTSAMASAMAEAGGAGTIHRGLDPETQAKEVRRTKYRLNGRIATPITIFENDTAAAVLQMCEGRRYQFRTFPVLNSEDGRVVGLVSGSDFDFCADTSRPIAAIMTPIDQLVTALKETTQEQALAIMRREKKKVLLLLDANRRLEGMYLFSDLRRIFANAGTAYNVDKNGQLVVGAAVGAGNAALARAELLAPRGCDYFQVDTAHADSRNVLDTILELKRAYPHIDVLAGNVSSGESARRLAAAGADGILVGQGPGSICTTRVVAGIGVPQVSAVYECLRAIADMGVDVPIVADGGINNSGDMVIALALGASCVMLGRLLAGTEESPGEKRIIGGMQVKVYRGMGSYGAMRDNVSSRERYRQSALTIDKVVPEGVEGVVPYRGSVADVLTQYVGGIRAGMGYIGAFNLTELTQRAQIFRITNAGLNESHPHDLKLTEEAPNYHGR